MYFNTVIRATLILLLSVSILSCNLKIGEKPPEAAVPEYKADSCFTAAGKSFGDFFAGEGKDEEIAAGWDCFGSMVKDFKSKVRCKIREKCSPAEIAQFVEDNFLDEEPSGTVSQSAVSAELQTQIMKFKKLFLGGNLEYISPEELDRLAQLMSQLKAISIEINPSMKVLTLKWENKLKSTVGLLDFEAVNVNLINVAQQVGGLIDKNDNTYRFDDFYQLVTEMSHFIGSQWSWIDTVKNYLPLVKKLKKSITGGDEESLKENEWNLFLLLGSRAYIQFLRYYYFIKDIDPEYTSLRLAYTARTVEEVFQILYDLLSFKVTHQVSKTELEELLQSFSNIWPVFKTSPGFVTETMKLKQVLVGGSENGFERNDFLRAQKKVNLIKQIVEKFVPYYQFYGFSWHPELLKQSDSYEYFSKGTNNLQEMSEKLTNEFRFESGYSLQNLLNLFDEVEKLYPTSPNKTPLRKSILEYACLIQLGTDIVLDTHNHQNSTSCDQVELSTLDLTRLVQKGSEIFGIYLDYYYFISRSRMLYNDLDFQIKFKDFGYKVAQFIKSSIDQRESKRISNYELKAILDEMTNLELIPKSIREKTIDSLLQTLLTKILVPADMKGRKIRFDGMEGYHAEQVYRELDNFLGINIYIHEAFENKMNQRFDYKSLLTRFKKGMAESTNPNFKLGMSEFIKNFESNYPMTLTTDNKILFKRMISPIYDKNTLEKFNLNRFIAGILMRSYATIEGKTDGKATIRNILTDCEVKEAYLDLKPILVDTDIISESSGTGFIDARFIEANLFLTKSDGNDTVSFDELAEFANYIFSGFVIDGEAKKLIANECQSYQVNKDVLVDLECLRSSYKKNMTKVFSAMPLYVNYSKAENPTEWDGAFLNNLKSAGYKPRQDLKVSLSDASLFPHILQYGETLFVKFDLNGDGFIDKKEGLKAYPYFAFLLKKVARKQLENGDIKESELEAMFTYILKYGKIPECNKTFVLLCLFDRNVTRWLSWKANYQNEEYTLMANRTQISKILGIISDMVTTSPSIQEETCTKKN